MLTRHERHSVNPNVNDRLFLGVGFKYCYVYTYLGNASEMTQFDYFIFFKLGGLFNHHRLGRKKSLKPSIGQNALGLSKFKMPQSSWEFPSQFPISKVVVPTSSFNLRPSVSQTHLSPLYHGNLRYPVPPQCHPPPKK